LKEARLNAFPQFVTNIDGLDIHFIHVRSKNPNALPLIVTHGWPGSVIEQLKIEDNRAADESHGTRRSLPHVYIGRTSSTFSPRRTSPSRWP
jgi:hypothetical protein